MPHGQSAASNTHSSSAPVAEKMKEYITWAARLIQAAKSEVGKDIFDQDEMVNLIFVALVGGGNILAEGMPGLAKTRTIKSISQATGLSTKRIQFTADLQPIDLTGSEVLDRKSNEWKFRPGPLFAQLVLADEVNRASDKTQSGLLEAMEEGQVTVDGETRSLPRPYHVMATQNPVDQGGTNKLPEAQADRFMLKAKFKYASRDAEVKIALSQSSTEADIGEMIEAHERFKQGDDSLGADMTTRKNPKGALKAQAVMTPQELIIIQDIARILPVSNEVAEKAVDLVRALRPEDSKDEFISRNVMAGPSPRSEISFLLAAKALVIAEKFNKNGALSPDARDIARLALPVLEHRMIMRPDREQGVEAEDVIKYVVKQMHLT